jgi:hypothetical protein
MLRLPLLGGEGVQRASGGKAGGSSDRIRFSDDAPSNVEGNSLKFPASESVRRRRCVALGGAGSKLGIAQDPLTGRWFVEGNRRDEDAARSPLRPTRLKLERSSGWQTQRAFGEAMQASAASGSQTDRPAIVAPLE